jgi:hypothetical protein
MDKINKSFNIELKLPFETEKQKEDYRKGNFNPTVNQKVNSVIDLSKKTSVYKYIMPDYVFDRLANSSPEYTTKPNQTNPNDPTYLRSKFTKTINGSSLQELLSNIQKVFNEYEEIFNRDIGKYELKIAINFNHSNREQKDNFNFAFTGKKTLSQFQFFKVYELSKKERKKLLAESYIYKTDSALISNISPISKSLNEKKWYYIHKNSLKNFDIIDYSDERFEYLTKIQNKLDSINSELSNFLNNIDDDKIELLMSQNKLLLE